MRSEDRLRSRCRLYLKAALPPPPEAFFSAIEHGRLHKGEDEFERMKEWQRMRGQGVKTGLPDMIAMWHMKFLAIELKVKSNKTSAVQDIFAGAWRANGGLYFVCKSVVELDEELRKAGFPVPRSMQIAAQSHDAALSVPEPARKRRGKSRFAFDGATEAAASAARLEEWLNEE